jgi:hypothetical protein
MRVRKPQNGGCNTDLKMNEVIQAWCVTKNESAEGETNIINSSGRCFGRTIPNVSGKYLENFKSLFNVFFLFSDKYAVFAIARKH